MQSEWHVIMSYAGSIPSSRSCFTATTCTLLYLALQTCKLKLKGQIAHQQDLVMTAILLWLSVIQALVCVSDSNLPCPFDIA